jgi:hypothetical protein
MATMHQPWNANRAATVPASVARMDEDMTIHVAGYITPLVGRLEGGARPSRADIEDEAYKCVELTLGQDMAGHVLRNDRLGSSHPCRKLCIYLCVGNGPPQFVLCAGAMVDQCSDTEGTIVRHVIIVVKNRLLATA